MNATQATSQAALHTAAQDIDHSAAAVIVDDLGIEELAVREEYAACYTVQK